MARILIVDFDTKCFRTIKEALESRPDHTVLIGSGNDTDVSPVESPKLHEILLSKSMDATFKQVSSHAIDLVFINSFMLRGQPSDWLKSLTEQSTRPQIKTILLDPNLTPETVNNFLNMGVLDLQSIPLDAMLFNQKLDVYITGKSAPSESEMYSMDINKPVDVAKPCQLQTISEFGLIIESDAEIPEGEVLLFYGPYFSEDKSGSALGRCFSSYSNKDKVIAKFFFTGITPATLKNIRRWLRQEYARKKTETAA